ncbi:MAG: TetR/AcrR family transcriptional regulator, partial [Solirubrobacterales bacterium]
ADSPTGRGRRVRRASGDQRELAILETAERLLETQSFHEISIDDLARGAGISRSTFYFYFESKQAVLLTLLDRIVLEANSARDRAMEAIEHDPASFLREAINAYFTSFGSHLAVTLAGAEAQATSPQIRALWSEVREGWVRDACVVIDAERARGAAPVTVATRDLVIALIQMNESVLRSTFTGEAPAVNPETLIDVLQSVWLNAVYGGVSPESLLELPPS